MRIRYRGSPSKSLFCEVLRSFSHSEGTTIYFPIPQRKTVLWSLKQSPVFCEVLRSFSYSEAPTLYFPIPRRETVLWSLKHRVSIQVCFLRGAAITFAFRSPYNLFPNTSKEDCTVVAKTWRSFFCEVLRSFSHSEGTTIYFPIPRRKTLPWSLKHGVSIQVCFLRGAAIIFAFRRPYNLFPNTSKEDCTVVAKTTSVHPGLFFARCCDHFRIPKPLQFVTQYLQGRLYRGR